MNKKDEHEFLQSCWDEIVKPQKNNNNKYRKRNRYIKYNNNRYINYKYQNDIDPGRKKGLLVIGFFMLVLIILKTLK